jgi:hypothetical protein
MIETEAYTKHAESTCFIITRLAEEAFLIFRVVLASGGAFGREACEQHHHESDDSGSLCLVSTPSGKYDWIELGDTHPVDCEGVVWLSNRGEPTEDQTKQSSY